MEKFTIIVAKTSTGYSGYSENYNVATTGADMHELETNILEALNFYWEEAGRNFVVTKENLIFKF